MDLFDVDNLSYDEPSYNDDPIYSGNEYIDKVNKSFDEIIKEIPFKGSNNE